MATMCTYVAGLGYRPGARERLAGMLDGEECRLRREPQNPHDRNAVAVHDGDFHLGYVPAADARAISAALARGLGVRATVDRRTSNIGLTIQWEST